MATQKRKRALAKQRRHGDLPEAAARDPAPQRETATPRSRPAAGGEGRGRRRTASSEPFGLRWRGERPAPLWGKFPLTEIVIVVAIAVLAYGLIRGRERGGAAIAAGIGLCALAVLEFTAREHFTGYRSHVLLLAFLPAVVFQVLVALLFGWANEVSVAASLAVFAALAATLWSVWLRERRRRAARSR